MNDPGQTDGPWDETESDARSAVTDEEGLLATVVSVLTRPVPTLRRLTSRPRVGWAVAVTVVVALLSWLAAAAQFGSPSVGAGGMGPEQEELRAAFMVVAVVGGPLFSLIGLAIWAGILHGVSLLLRGEGSYPGLFVGLGFANVPSVFTVVGQLLGLAGLAGVILGGLVNFALAAWVVVLGIIAVRENYGFSTGRAVAAVLIPFSIVIALVVVLMVAAFFALMAGGG